MVDYDIISKQSQFVNSIIQFMRGTTGSNFQNNVGIVLREYYKYNDKEYIMPEPMRGDYKNDGYVPSENLFYMIYSPLSHIDNITKDIKEKFESDIKGLFDNVYIKNMWGGNIKKTIFLVNNIDKRLPPDPNGFFDNIVMECKNKYNIDFENQLMDIYDFKIYLEVLPLDVLIRLKTTLNMSNEIDFNTPNAKDIIETISCIAKNCNLSMLNPKLQDYKRISTPKKIEINKLEDRKNEINSILDKATVVNDVIKEMNQDITQISKFEITKQYIIDTYEELSKTYTGAELYDLIINKTLEANGCKEALEIPLKFLVVYIFDKCDIFKKEG